MGGRLAREVGHCWFFRKDSPRGVAKELPRPYSEPMNPTTKRADRILVGYLAAFATILALCALSQRGAL